MKVFSKARLRRGFTLIELMVAMAVTTIIVSVLVSITSIALDTWTRSRSEVRAARQAKSMVDSMVTDFESLVTRGGNNFEWLWAKYSTQDLGTETLKSSNASELVFYTAATDRYDGNLTDVNSLGDVSCVAYQLKYQDPIQGELRDDQASPFPTFVLYRSIVDPDDTFRDLLGSVDLERAFSRYMRERSDVKNFLCENVYQYTLTFHVEVTSIVSGEQRTQIGRVTLGESTSGVREFRVFGDNLEIIGGTSARSRSRSGSGAGGGLRTSGLQSASGLGRSNSGTLRSGSRTSQLTAEDMRKGRVTALEVSLTVLTDYAIDQMRNRSFKTEEAKSKFIAENSYQYSKLVELPKR